MESAIGFTSGAVFGLTSVVVGQPLDTLKTIKQSTNQPLPYSQIVKDLYKTDGIVKGLYRGSVAPLLGGAFFRSAQFGFYETTMDILRKNSTDHKYFGFLSWHVAVAGASGGMGRAFVETFADLIKVRKMVGVPWTLHALRRESGLKITLIRNVNLFGSFVIFMDLSRQLTGGQLGPFLTGGICASAAWFTIWPLDVVRTRVQSGVFHKDQSLAWQLAQVLKSPREMTRGMGPGLIRSFYANGCAMFMYRQTETLLRGMLTEKERL